MFWIKLLITLIYLYMLFASATLIGGTVSSLISNPKYNLHEHGTLKLVFLACLLAVIIFIFAMPLVMMLNGSLAINPVYVGLDIMIMYLLHQSGFSFRI